MDPNAAPPPGAPISAQNFPPIDEIYGAMLIGVFLNCILFGIMVVQAFIYYQTYPTDRKWLKIFVAYLFLAETANTACNMYLIYEPVIQRFGKIEALMLFPRMLAAAAILPVLISTPVQMFMAWRIKVITGTYLVGLVICFFSLISLAGGCMVTANVVILKTFDKKDTFRFNFPGVMWFVASAVADVLITVTLVFTLNRRKTGHSKTTSAINRIIRLTIQTGLVTMVFALLDLLLFTLSSKTAISFVFDFCISKLYTNALLSSLNARAGWNHLNNGDDDNVLFGSSTTNFTRGNTLGNTTSMGSARPTFTTGSQTAIRKGADSSFADTYELTGKGGSRGEVTIKVESQVRTDDNDYRKPGHL
ncbi:hypothetical protein L218DRAFT_928856 [Marasmius fiardii PR-910]|nr:hypothetical protein L218DRAFT_928856 [Marasmius fiardii PR-910]